MNKRKKIKKKTKTGEVETTRREMKTERREKKMAIRQKMERRIKRIRHKAKIRRRQNQKETMKIWIINEDKLMFIASCLSIYDIIVYLYVICIYYILIILFNSIM